MSYSELTAQQSEHGGDQGAMARALLPAYWVGCGRVSPQRCTMECKVPPTPSIPAPSPSALLDWLCYSSQREGENIIHVAFGRLVTKGTH